jgi:Ca-activated chloride channel family protein
MMRFSHAWILWSLLSLLPLAWLAWREATAPLRGLKDWGGMDTVRRLMPGWSRGRVLLRGAIGLLGLALVMLAAAGPQLGTRSIEVERKGVDVVVAVDVSQSMAAQDLSPDRMARARHSIRMLLEQLKGDRVALLPFSGGTHLQHPLTSDYALSGVMTDLLRPGLIPTPGTDLGAAIRKAVGVYQDTSPGQRVLILLSDGEDLEEDWRDALAEARKAGVTIHCVGMGTPDGAPVPDPERPGAYKTDAAGSIVLSRLNEDVLQKLASEGGGLYLRSTPGGDELVKILERIGEMEGRDLGSRMYTGWQERYATFLLPGMFLLVLSWLWPTRRRVEALVWPLLFLLWALPARADNATENNRAVRAYGKGDFGAATQGFARSLSKKENAQARFNLGDALFRSGDLQGAADQYRLVAGEGSGADEGLKARAYANLGRVLLDQQQLEPACQALEEALARRPDLPEARHNLELALRRQDQQQDKGKDKSQDKQQGQQDSKDKQQGQDKPDGQQQQDDKGKSGQQKEEQKGQEQQEQQGQQGQQGQDEGQEGQAAREERIDEAQMQQLLNDVGAQERQSLQKQLKRIPGRPRKVEKDW